MARHRGTLQLSISTLVSVFSLSQLASTLQVTPNSPCAALCLDSPDLDASDPNSSNTRNSDISCHDDDYASPAGTKFRNCVTCLQDSGFSQGSESDSMWFLYNLRYTAANCLWNYPNNATGLGSTPCTTELACGPLISTIEHGILDPRNTTPYSYCSAANNAGMSYELFEKCTSCIASDPRTHYLANFFVALEAGCQQQPAQGVVLGLNDTVFTESLIHIVNPAALLTAGSSSTALPTPTIVGVAAGGLVFLLIVVAVTFVCVRKRKNRRTRANAEAQFYSRFARRPQSSTSFQCQTHMMSPRFWPGAEQGVTSPADEKVHAHDPRSSVWKQHETMPIREEPVSPYQDDIAHITKKAASAAPSLHHLTTDIPPPPQTYSSPSTAGVYSPSDFNPLSADSVRSTAALLPSIKAYVPAEHGVHGASHGSPVLASASTFSSPTSGTGGTPLLRGGAWSEQTPPRQHSNKPSQKHAARPGDSVLPPPPPPPTPPKTGRSGIAGSKKNARNARNAAVASGAGSPVESWEIQTAFAAPPKR
ncbi:hypothetical protein MFIFM68171_04285 [Madurella fahalii]|uniref:LPXTG-domain-containing protein n=1 Tax=Madurella fahalii TaxID=1157608 RepID=A0ABQ0G8H6_9PEZI